VEIGLTLLGRDARIALELHALVLFVRLKFAVLNAQVGNFVSNQSLDAAQTENAVQN
jgi:hypothetical protein